MGSYWNNDPSKKLTDSRICPRLHHVCGTIARLQNQQNQGTKSANAYGNNFGSATVLTLDIVAFLRIVFRVSDFRAVAHWLFNACPGRWSDFPPLKNSWSPNHEGTWDDFPHFKKGWYCWWHQLICKYPIINRVLYIPGGAGFLPLTVFILSQFTFRGVSAASIYVGKGK